MQATEQLTEQKQSIKDFFDALNKKEFKTAFTYFHDDLQWWIIGNIQVSGKKDKRGMQTGFKLLFRLFSELRFELGEFTEEGNRVSATAESKGTTTSGKVYHNHYHFLITFQDGKFANVKEYLDTQHAASLEG
ncbi:MAG: nuclear transport factor 2 family protein [Spirochaetota bacterium]